MQSPKALFNFTTIFRNVLSPKNRPGIIVGCCYFLIILLLPMAMYYLHMRNFTELATWLDVFKNAYYVNLILIFVLFLIFYALTNSAFYSLIILTAVTMLFSISDMQKMRILHQPLLPGDFLFFKQALFVAKMYAVPAALGLLALAGICIGLFLIRKKVTHFSLPLLVRTLVILVCGSSITWFSLNFSKAINRTNNHYKLVNEYWNQLSNFQKNGILYSFIMNLESLSIPRPQEYNQKRMASIFSALPADSIKKPPVTPDVIIILSESFWDITQAQGVKLPCDPIPLFRKLCKKKRCTKLISPVFGGNTCNAEFEVLTGMTHGFFPPGVMAYNQFIQHPVPSLVKVFKENGYHTTAIHTFKQWFWNRVNVYRQLGFEKFLPLESIPEPITKGFYVADRQLADMIISEASASGKPDFVFAISMQNHGPYDCKRYDTLDCEIKTGLSHKADFELNSYVQGLIDADKSLKQIMRYIDTTRQPTMVVFFGDHLPGFTNYYQESGIQEQIKSNPEWSYTTTAVWYSNFKMKPLTDSIVNMFYLPLLVAKQASLDIPDYYRLLDTLKSEFPVLKNVPRDSANFSERDSLLCKRRTDCWLCVYDALLGKSYSGKYHSLKK